MLDDEDAKKAKAQLEAMGDDVHFRSPGKRKWVIGGVLVVLGITLGTYAFLENRRRSYATPEPSTRAKGEEGCPCGCDRSVAMAAALREARETAPDTIALTLSTIAERESASYITERMIQHRLRMLDVAEELHVAAEVREARLTERAAAAAAPRCEVAGASATSATLRVCSELVVHGERLEIVDGHDKLITSSFRLWLEIENTSGGERVIDPPTIEAGPVHFPISRWYEESGAGEPWDGVLRPGERVRVNVIGDIPEHITPGTVVDATIGVDSMSIAARAEARAVIHIER